LVGQTGLPWEEAEGPVAKSEPNAAHHSRTHKRQSRLNDRLSVVCAVPSFMRIVLEEGASKLGREFRRCLRPGWLR
jgi:hypothetical protein